MVVQLRVINSVQQSSNEETIFSKESVQVDVDAGVSVGRDQGKSNSDPMSDMNREEVQARLEASEARVATAVESMRADNAQIRADLQSGIKAIEAQGLVMRSEASAFFADARRVLADIQVAQEKERNQYYALGYKIIVWAAATFIALAGTFATVWGAFHNDPIPASPPAAQPEAKAPATRSEPSAVRSSPNAASPQKPKV